MKVTIRIQKKMQFEKQDPSLTDKYDINNIPHIFLAKIAMSLTIRLLLSGLV